MSISEELYLSILAMDSYNRGYDVGINVENGLPAGATFLLDSGIAADSLEVQSGFYAIAYTLGSDAPLGLAGTTVISYRGTDSVGIDAEAGAVGGSDPINRPQRMILRHMIFQRELVEQCSLCFLPRSHHCQSLPAG